MILSGWNLNIESEENLNRNWRESEEYRGGRRAVFGEKRHITQRNRRRQTSFDVWSQCHERSDPKRQFCHRHTKVVTYFCRSETAVWSVWVSEIFPAEEWVLSDNCQTDTDTHRPNLRTVGISAVPLLFGMWEIRIIQKTEIKRKNLSSSLCCLRTLAI